MSKEKVSISWSGGKDSALSLYEILRSGKYDVVNLHTTFDGELKRVGMHGIPEILIEQQADAIGIPLEKIFLPKDKSNKSYEAVMQQFCESQKAKGISKFIYGDIFLEDLRQYREKQLEKVGLEAVFPIWGQDTYTLAHAFVNYGFKTLICCASSKHFTNSIMGKTIDNHFIENLPAGVDPCGENGEFHTFTYDGPIFKAPLAFNTGGSILKHYDIKSTDQKEKSGFWFLKVK